jgi:hypothetical protein
MNSQTPDTPDIAGYAEVAPLRQAASRLREGVAMIRESCHTDWGDRPWAVTQCASSETGNCTCIVYQGEYKRADEPQVPLIQYVADAETEAHAAWIARMGPALGLLLADWLDAEANAFEVYEGGSTDQALAVARAVLAE